MKKFTLSFLAICTLSLSYASMPGTYHVDNNNMVTVGDKVDTCKTDKINVDAVKDVVKDIKPLKMMNSRMERSTPSFNDSSRNKRR